MKKRVSVFLIGFILCPALAAGRAQREEPPISRFLEAARSESDVAERALNEIAAQWRNGYAPFFVDLARLMSPRSGVRQRLIRFLEQQTGEDFGQDLVAWQRWMWGVPYDPHPEYGLFKGLIYGQIDPQMREFFPLGAQSDIRLDEVDWGGVGVNGIPPLDHPDHVSAAEATYLDDDNVVFGVSINGEARAYPKRILAWHEMALDVIGGVEMTLIYCTLCGTVLPYESEVDGVVRQFGTSGLLYRSNKLFFDAMTMSLWSTLEGRPVVGRLVGSDLRLRLRSSVTTTWGEWRRRHPDTQVLSIDTGHVRDYREGVAYRSYFSTDELMFPVSQTDDRLDNKDEVLVMLVESEPDSSERIPVAISTVLLLANRTFPFGVRGRSFVAITSPEGANRVYDAGSVRFPIGASAENVVDDGGRRWRVEEHALVALDASGTELERVTANRAFWFGWYAQFPDTELIR